MSEQGMDQTQSVEQRMASLESDLRRRKLSDVYARFYAPIAVVILALTFMPLFEDVVIEDNGEVVLTVTYGSLWELVGRDRGGSAATGLMLVLLFVGLLALASVRVKTDGLPIGIAVTAVLILLMLIGKPGTGDPTPELSGSGVAGAVLALLAIVIVVIHAVHLALRR
jgi:hypothetical protein